jgi:adenylate cyclase
VGAAERYEYTIIGDPVNEAARFSDLAKTHTGRVLASEATVVSASGTAGNWCRRGEAVLRGRNLPTVLYAPA